MNTKSANPSPASDSSRCQHRFANGQRCRLLASGSETNYCPRHAKLPQNQREPADLTDTLTAGLGEFTSAAPINDFLSRLLLLLAQNRISPRRAAVLAYVANQLLHTLSAMEKEATAKDSKKAPIKIIWDLPRPPHEQGDQP
jgi:hypothetical protein